MEIEPRTKEKFNLFISKIPVFHRHITEQAVLNKAQEIARARNSARIEEEDIIAAFFLDVPSPFYSMMVRLLEQTGFDYGKCGFPKNGRSK